MNTKRGITLEEKRQAVPIIEKDAGKKEFFKRFLKLCHKSGFDEEGAKKVFETMAKVAKEGIRDVDTFKRRLNEELQSIDIHSKAKRKKLVNETYRLAERYLR